jgi:hypothetical protein
MIVNKITTGFVIQKFDSDTKEFVSQEFIAGDQVDVEDEFGEPMSSYIKECTDIDNHYLPFEMKQPSEMK